MIAQTDKQRILQLEAQVAGLTEEVEAWRASDRENLLLSTVTQREVGIRSRVLGQIPPSPQRSGYGGVVILLLIHMMDRPGRLMTRQELYKLIVRDADGDTDLKIVDVRITQVRHVIQALGVSRKGIETVWGKGYRLLPDAAAILKSKLEPAAQAVAA